MIGWETVATRDEKSLEPHVNTKGIIHCNSRFVGVCLEPPLGLVWQGVSQVLFFKNETRRVHGVGEKLERVTLRNEST